MTLSDLLYQYKSTNPDKKRLYPKPPPKLQGVVFPEQKPGDRSTTAMGKKVFSAALRPVDSAAAEKVRSLVYAALSYSCMRP